MLETIREFALEQLVVSAEEVETRRAHATWCSAMAEHAWKGLVVRADNDLLDQLEVEHGNLRAALAWLDQTGDVAGLLQLTGALGEFWQFRANRREGLAWLERALDRTQGTDIPATVQVRALHGASWLARDLGDPKRATELANACLSLSRAWGEDRDVALATELLGYAALAEGDYGRAEEYAREAHALFEALGDRWLAGATRADIALAALGKGDLDGASTGLNAALAHFSALEDDVYPPNLLIYLGLVACMRGDCVESAARLAESLRLTRQNINRGRLDKWLAAVATLAAASGASEQAVRLFAAAETMRKDRGNTFVQPERTIFEQSEATARAALADDDYAASVDTGSTLTSDAAVAAGQALLETIARGNTTPQ